MAPSPLTHNTSRGIVVAVLTTLFLFAVFMGAGPGLRWANDGGATTILGLQLPRLYAWGMLWFVVQTIAIVLAYIFLWRHDDDGTTQQLPPGDTSQRLAATDETTSERGASEEASPKPPLSEGSDTA